jgi:hypothetical protein
LQLAGTYCLNYGNFRNLVTLAAFVFHKNLYMSCAGFFVVAKWQKITPKQKRWLCMI